MRVTGIGRARGFPVKRAELFLGNAGTAFRPLTAVLALADGHYVLSGVPRMHERPIGDLVEALRAGRARASTTSATPGFPPLAIAPRERARRSRTLRVRGDVSSQFLSALLMALPWAGDGARIEVEGELISKPYVELTLGPHGALRRRGRARGLERLRDPAGQRLRLAGQRSTSRAMRRRPRTSSPRARSAAGRCASRAWDARAVQGDVRFAEVLEAMGAHGHDGRGLDGGARQRRRSSPSTST